MAMLQAHWIEGRKLWNLLKNWSLQKKQKTS